MSRIFDALQRSEAERSGSREEAARVTELLQRTESYAAAKWETTDQLEDRTPAGSAHREAVAEIHREVPVVVPRERTAASAVLPIEVHGEGLSNCTPLVVSPPFQSRLVCLPDNENPAVEAFHLLGVRLRHLRRGRPLKKVLITSTIPQEGKSMVAANLACTLALRTQQKVLLLEGDVRRPTQSDVFGIGRQSGICEWLRGARTLLESIYRLEGPGVWILPAMMEQLTAWFDWIIIDSPPVLPLADTSVWTNLADGILLVTRQGTTQKKQLQRGLEALGSQKLIGAILNSSKNAANSDYYYRPTNRLPNDDPES